MKKISKHTKDKIMSYLYMTIGVMIAAIAYSFFLAPNALVIGGVSGVGVMVNETIGHGIDSYVMLAINLVLLGLSFFTLGKEFFIKTIFGSVAFPIFCGIFNMIYGLFTKLVNSSSEIDIFIVVLFASIIMGYGLGLVVKYGGSTGGTEIPQKIMYQKLHFPYSISLYLVDGTVILLGFFILEQDISFILYEVVFMVICGFVMDTTIFSGFNKRCVNVISEKCEEIKEILLKNFARGVTSVKVIGEFSKQEKKMLVCVLSTLEYYKLREIIQEIDPKAFLYCTRASEVRGEGFTYDSE